MVTEKDIRDMLTNLEKWIDGKIKDYESVSKRHNDPEIIMSNETKEIKRRYCDVKSTRKRIDEDSYISLSSGQLECAKNHGLTLFRVHNVTEHKVDNCHYYKVKIPKETNNQYFNFQITDMTFMVPGRVNTK